MEEAPLKINKNPLLNHQENIWIGNSESRVCLHIFFKLLFCVKL